jgi:hypothetical protein
MRPATAAADTRQDSRVGTAAAGTGSVVVVDTRPATAEAGTLHTEAPGVDKAITQQGLVLRHASACVSVRTEHPPPLTLTRGCTRGQRSSSAPQCQAAEDSEAGGSLPRNQVEGRERPGSRTAAGRCRPRGHHKKVAAAATCSLFLLCFSAFCATPRSCSSLGGRDERWSASLARAGGSKRTCVGCRSRALVGVRVLWPPNNLLQHLLQPQGRRSCGV